MRIPEWLRRRLEARACRVMASRPPDFRIDPAGTGRPYLERWWLTRRRRWGRIYLHRILRSDDDRALHDHPWPYLTLILSGGYVEHTILPGGVHQRRYLGPGRVAVHGARRAHRLEIAGVEAVTMFVCGPRVRDWGFHCPQGWRHWRDFVAPDDAGRDGRGCGD